MVKEYEKIPIASDSDDEKRIYKAEARASRKVKAERTKRGRGRSWPYRTRRQTEMISGNNLQVKAPESKKPGLCFSCGMPGHWAKDKECQAPKSNNKISIFDFAETVDKIQDNKIFQSSQCKDTDLLLSEYQDNSALSESEKTLSACRSTISLSSTDTVESTLVQGHGTSVLQSEKVKQKNMEQSENVCSPVGRLKNSIRKWEEIGTSRYILNVIEKGYRLPLKTCPQSVYLKNNRSARENPGFVEEEISILLNKGVISEYDSPPWVINPLTVAYSKSGKPRMVLDCRHINPPLHKFKFKYEDIKIAENMFEKGAYLFTFDLKGAYHHIPILEENRTYLGFAWINNQNVKHYVFNVLPFGISTAGHIFSKVLRELVKYWRSLGHKIVMFLDDGIGGSACFEAALASSNFVRNSIVEFGFLLAHEKCNWEPVRVAVWLGHVLNMNDNKLFITDERIGRLEIFIDSIMYQLKGHTPEIIKVRVLASVVGQVISLQSVLGKIVRLRTRELYNCIMSKASWNAPVLVRQGAKDELLFWRKNARLLNQQGKQINAETIFDLRMCTDASSTGYGGYLEECAYCHDVSVYKQASTSEEGTLKTSEMVGEKERTPDMGSQFRETVLNAAGELPPEVGLKVLTHEDKSSSGSLTLSGRRVSVMQDNAYQGVFGQFGKETVLANETLSRATVVGYWNKQEQMKSSTWREVEAVRRVLQSNVEILRNKHVKLLSDNKNVSSVLQIGSRQSDLQKLALDTYHICEKESIIISPEWIPREDNIRADNLSRCTDSDDWSVKWWVFEMLDKKWGPHSVDRFASHFNNKCVRFNSRWWVPGTEAIDALNEKWTGENNWLVPPPRLISNCINKIEMEKANGTLVLPEWRSAPYWPLLFNDQHKFKFYISEIISLPKKNIIDAGFSNNGIFQRNPLSFKMIAIRVCF